ncbi:MAG: chitobiase/beta-hexosaminidase C-terminal domain-containing protein [Terracidiphilus sp.]|jgi:hypothetical protein
MTKRRLLPGYLCVGLLAFVGISLSAGAQTSAVNEWAWMGGPDTTDKPGVYPASPGLSTASTTNIPGSRFGAVSWTDKNGNLWLFGGEGYDSAGHEGYLNDLWKFDSSTGKWAWMGGGNTVPTGCTGSAGICGNSGVYGTSQTFSAGNIPGGRNNAASWIDGNGNLWLFGGQGYDSANNYGDLNDLWEFNPALGTSGEWAWVGGSSTLDCTTSGTYTYCSNWPGVYGQKSSFADGNNPGSRSSGVSWIDKNGNFWLFSGDDGLNDLWEFSPTLGTAGQWAWMSGNDSGYTNGYYGTLGTPGGVPGTRVKAAGWTDNSGNLWLFGGNGLDSAPYLDGKPGDLNDLWEYNPSTSQWTWMGGSSLFVNEAYLIGSLGVYGTLGQPAAANVPGGRYGMTSWKDNSGNFWLFGGSGFSAASSYSIFAGTLSGQDEPLNDLWEYNPTTGQWTWMGGQSTNTCTGICDLPGVYGTLQTPAFANNPPGRLDAVSWTDKSGNLWLCGGTGDNYYLDTDLFGDVWESQPTTNTRPVTPAPTFSPAAGSYTSQQSVTISDTAPNTTIYISNSGAPTSASTIFGSVYGSGAVPVAWSQTLQAVAQITNYALSPVATATYTLNMPAVATPAFSLVGVGTYDSAPVEYVEISDTTPGAQISYSFGPLTPYTFPNTSGPLGPPANNIITTLPAGQTFYAIAEEYGFADSAIASVTYPATFPVAAAPTFSVASGTYTTIQSVTLSDTAPGASIYYTIDGSTPTLCDPSVCGPNGTLYTGPITVPETMTIKAFAVAPGYTYSSAASASYTFNPITFGGVNIGTSATGSVIVVIPAAATLATISVVTEGAQNEDFTNAGGGTCTVGTSYTAMSACMVNVSFAPRYAGARYGAAVLYDASGNVIGTGYVQGTGQGPQIIFASSATQPSIAVNGFTNPFGMTADTNGNLFVNNSLDSTQENEYLLKETLQPNGAYLPSTIAEMAFGGSSMTVDGSGNLYDPMTYYGVPGSAIDGIPALMPTPGGGYFPCITHCAQFGTQAVDGAGNLYTPSSQYLYQPGSIGDYVPGKSYGYNSADDITDEVAVDGAGNAYFAAVVQPNTWGLLYPPCFHANTYICPYETIDEVFANSNSTTPSGMLIEEELGANVWVNVAIAVDRMGDAYFTAQTTDPSQTNSYQLLVERAALQPDGSYTFTQIGTGWVKPTALATDELGNAYVLDAGAKPSPAVYKFDYADPPALSFVNTGEGSTSADSPQIVTVTNYGNMPLQLSGITVPTDFSLISSAANACTGTTSLAALQSCVLSISFTPVTPLNGASSIALNESIAFTSNTLNTASTTSTIKLTGTEIVPVAATPAISLAAGIYAPGQTVTIGDTTPGATIYYAINETPVAGTNPYNGAITLNASETIEALAVANGYTNSAIASAAYTIEPPASTPAFSIAAGTYYSGQPVTIGDTTPNAVIYYTTDGTTPTTSSNQYYGAITLSSTETLEAIATANNYSQSAVATATYTILPPNPAPVVSGISPSLINASSAAFTLTVNGSGFVANSAVYWGASALATTFVNATQLTAQVTAAEIASAETVAVMVQTPTPGGGTSNGFQFEVNSAGSTAPAFSPSTATVTAGSPASYTITLGSSVESASVACLNLPAGATCSYSSATNTVTITTTSATPKGTYQITVVFSETVSGAASGWILLPFLLLPLALLRKKLTAKGAWITASLAITLLAAATLSTGCGGGSGGSGCVSNCNPPPQTHQVTTSAVVTLIVQ